MRRATMTALALWLPALLALCLVATEAVALTHEYTMDLPAAQTFSAELTTAAPQSTVEIPLDADAMVLLSSVSLALQPVLVGPSGATYAIGDAPRDGVVSGVDPDPSTPGISGTNYYWILQGAATGLWSVTVTQTGGVSAPVQLFFTVMIASGRSAGLLGVGEQYPVGATVNLGFVLVDDGALVMSSEPSGRLFKIGDPSFPDTEVAFADADGDGIYEYPFAATQAGTYQVNVQAEAGNGPGRFRRTASGRFTVVQPAGILDGSFLDRGIDDDQDGLLDAIGVKPRFEILESAEYLLTVQLRGSAGGVLTETVQASAAVGYHEWEVRFDSARVREELAAGPYDVELVRLERLETERAVTQDEKYELGMTAAYDPGLFERGAIILAGTLVSEGLDYDGNQLFDALRVTVPLDLLNAGNHSFSGRLVASDGAELGFDSGTAYLAAGLQSVVLTFPGEAIGAHGVNGPYELRNFIIYSGGNSLIANGAGFTDPYLASQFEGYVQPDTTPPQLVVSIEPDGCWPPSHELMSIVPEILVVDDYDPDPVVALEGITCNELEDMVGDGNTSPDIVIDPVTGAISLRCERTGTGEGRIYSLHYSAVDAAGNVSYATATFAVPHDHSGEAVARQLLIAASTVRGAASQNWNLRWVSSGRLTEEAISFSLVDPNDPTWEPLVLATSDRGNGHLLVTAPEDRRSGLVVRADAWVKGQLVATGVVPAPTVGMTSGVGDGAPEPGAYLHAQWTGNRITIAYELKESGKVRLGVFDIRGALVNQAVNEWQAAGPHTMFVGDVDSRGARLPSGVYLVRMEGDGRVWTDKIAIVR